MSFTFATPFNDIARVRFYTNDTDESTARFSDELITAVITEAGSWQQAAIMFLDKIILELSEPGFSADWLKVDNATARKAYQETRDRLVKQLGSNVITGTASPVYRADSHQVDADYTESTLNPLIWNFYDEI